MIKRPKIGGQSVQYEPLARRTISLVFLCDGGRVELPPAEPAVHRLVDQLGPLHVDVVRDAGEELRVMGYFSCHMAMNLSRDHVQVLSLWLCTLCTKSMVSWNKSNILRGTSFDIKPNCRNYESENYLARITIWNF